MYDDGNNRTGDSNPFTPISYTERLSAPLKRSERVKEEAPMRPGQFYSGAYDKWMSRPAPLAPLKRRDEAPTEPFKPYAPEPWAGFSNPEPYESAPPAWDMNSARIDAVQPPFEPPVQQPVQPFIQPPITAYEPEPKPSGGARTRRRRADKPREYEAPAPMPEEPQAVYPQYVPEEPQAVYPQYTPEDSDAFSAPYFSPPGGLEDIKPFSPEGDAIPSEAYDDKGDDYLPPPPVEASQPTDEIAAFFGDGGIFSDIGSEAANDEAPVSAEIKRDLPEPIPKPADEPKAEKANARRVRPWRVVALVSIVGMIVFIIIAGGGILVDLARNKQEIKDFRDAYKEETGVLPEQDGALVTLLPYGQTFEPTSTPYVPQTPSPTPVIPMNEAAIQSLDGRDKSDIIETEAPSPTPQPRTRLEAYPNNPLRNMIDSVKQLQEQNADIVGRLVIDGVIDEVVVQRNNTYYLTHSYRGGASKAGAVFVDESCAFKSPPENLLLRGQDVVDGRVFAPLWQYRDSGSAFVASATAARLTTPYEEADYVLFATIVVNQSNGGSFNYAGHPTFASDDEMLDYVESARSLSLYQFNVNVDASDRLLTLATVGDRDETMVLIFRMLREGERRR